MANSVAGALWLLAGEDDPEPGIRLLDDDGPMIRTADSGLSQAFGGFDSGWQTI